MERRKKLLKNPEVSGGRTSNFSRQNFSPCEVELVRISDPKNSTKSKLPSARFRERYAEREITKYAETQNSHRKKKLRGKPESPPTAYKKTGPREPVKKENFTSWRQNYTKPSTFCNYKMFFISLSDDNQIEEWTDEQQNLPEAQSKVVMLDSEITHAAKTVISY